jgi:DNA-binding transcriptional LysR family regulator
VVELRQLRAFVRVTQAGTFTRAAEELHLAQSAVSHAVGRLERELGFELLHRASRGVELTEAGKLVFERAREVVAGDELVSVRELVAGSLGVSVVPRSTVDGDGPRVAATRIGPPALRRPLTLVWRERRQPPAAGAFLSFVRAAAAANRLPLIG